MGRLDNFYSEHMAPASSETGGEGVPSGAASAFLPPIPSTNVYVDGFNLYYGTTKGTPYKWLDIGHLCRLLHPNNSINRIKYFTARVSTRPGDPWHR